MAKNEAQSAEDAAKEMNVSLSVDQALNGDYLADQYGPPTLNHALIGHLCWAWQKYQYDHAKGLMTSDSARAFFLLNCVGVLQLLLKYEKIPPNIDAHYSVSAMHVIAADIGRKITKATAARQIRSYSVHFVGMVRESDLLKQEIGITGAYQIVFASLSKHCSRLSGAKSWKTVKHWDVSKSNPDSSAPIDTVTPVPVIIENREHYSRYVDRMLYMMGLIYAPLAESRG